jgi:GDP-L-fucose synthase
MIQTNNLMGVIKSLGSICNHKLKLYSFVKFLLYFFIASNQIVLFSQINENNFNKVIIEVDGEIVFDTEKPDGTPQKLLDVSRMDGLGWKAKISLREGIEGTYQFYKRQ